MCGLSNHNLKKRVILHFMPLVILIIVSTAFIIMNSIFNLGYEKYTMAFIGITFIRGTELLLLITFRSLLKYKYRIIEGITLIIILLTLFVIILLKRNDSVYFLIYTYILAKLTNWAINEIKKYILLQMMKYNLSKNDFIFSGNSLLY